MISRRKLMCLMLASSLFYGPLIQAGTTKVESILQAEHRSESNKARDIYRHPAETLAFFGIKPNMSVIEIWPGGGAWYTEILAPYLKNKGTLYLADFDTDMTSDYMKASRKKLRAKLDTNADVYGKTKLVGFNPKNNNDIVPENSVDGVLTFRNIHNWYMRGGGTDKLNTAFSQFYRALKPGGILGVVEHRLPEERSDNDQDKSGYMKQSVVIAAAEKAGFKLVATSEINANDKDTSQYEKGVWSLPPNLRLGDKDRARYIAIGESDRMTLKFMKPE